MDKTARPWARGFLIIAFVAASLGAAGVWGVQSAVFERFLVSRLPGWARQAGLRLEIESLNLDVPNLAVRAGGLKLAHGGGDWRFEARQVAVDVHLLRSLGGSLHLSIELDSPNAQAAVHLAEETKFELPDLVLDTLRVSNGAVAVTDLDYGLRFVVPEIEVQWLQGQGWGRAQRGGIWWKGSEERLVEASFAGSRRLGILSATRVRLQTDRLRVSGSGRLGLKQLLEGTLEADLNLRDLPEAWVRAVELENYLPITGTVTARGRVAGRLKEPRFDGRLAVGKGRFGPLPFDGASAKLSADVGGLGFADLEARSGAGSARRVSGKVSWGRTVQLQARGEAVDYDLRPFMALFVDGFFPVGFKASGTFEAQGPLYPKLALSCKVDAVGRDLDVTTVEEEGPTTWFSLAKGRVTSRCVVGEDEAILGPTTVDGGSVVVRIPSGRVEYVKGLDFETDVEVANLDLVRQYLPEERGPIDVRGRAKGRMVGPYESLAFHYRLDLESTTLWGKPLGALTATADFDLLDLVLKDGVLHGPLGRVEAGGTARLRKGGKLDLDAAWSEGDLAAVADLIRVVAPSFPSDLKGTASAGGKVAGTIEDPVLHGEVIMPQLSLLGAEVDRAAGRGAFGLTHWDVDQLSLSAYGAQVEAQGRADLAGFAAQGTVSTLSLARLDKLVGRELPVGAVFSGSFSGQGPYENPGATLRGSVSGISVAGYAIGEGEVEGGLRNRMVDLDVKAYGGAAKARVRIGLEGQRPFSVAAEAQKVPRGALPAGIVPEILLAESVFGRGSVEGSLSEGKGVTAAHWEGTLTGSRFQDLPLGVIETRVDYDGTDLRVLARGWEGEAAADLVLKPGRAGAPMRVQFRARELDLARLSAVIPVPTGRISAEGGGLVDLEVLNGAKGARKLAAVRDLRLRGTAAEVVGPRWIRLPRFAFEARKPAEALEVHVEGNGVKARWSLVDLERLAWTGEGDLQATSLSSFFPEGHPVGRLRGAVDGRFSAAGEEAKVSDGAAGIEVRDFSWGPLAASHWVISATVAGGLAGFQVREPRGVSASGSWSAADGLAASLRLERVALEKWFKAGVAPEDFAGIVQGEGELRLRPAGTPSGTLRLQRLSASLPPVRLENQGDLVIRYEQGSVHLSSVRLGGQGVEFTASGRLSPLKSWDLKAKGEADLGFLGRLAPGVRSASGKVAAEVAVSGPWKSPTFEGPVNIPRGAKIALDALDLDAQELEAKGFLERRGLLVDSLDAELGDGRVHAEGLLGLEGFRPKTLRFLVELRDVAHEWPRQATYRVDADGVLTGTVDRPEVRGEVRLEQFLYTRRVNWKSMLFEYLKRRPREVQTAAPRSGVFVDVSVRGKQDLKIENNVVDLSLAVDLRARGYLPSPALYGRVEVQEGKARFRSQEYEAMRSFVEFLGEAQPVPLLDLHAKTTVRQYAVTVDVSGPLDSYQVNLSSVPPLQQNDLVALLSVGETSQTLSQGSQSVTATEATSFITGQVQDELETQVSDLLGFDQFHVDPAFSTSNQTTVPRVTVGKTLTQSLSARYSTSIGGEIEQDLEVQYNVTPSVQLLGTWADKGSESQGSAGGKVRFRFTFR